MQEEADKEWRSRPQRRWRFDLTWPPHRLAVEVDGGTWTHARHTRAAGYEADCERLNQAALDGWRVLGAPTRMVIIAFPPT